MCGDNEVAYISSPMNCLVYKLSSIISKLAWFLCTVRSSWSDPVRYLAACVSKLKRNTIDQLKPDTVATVYETIIVTMTVGKMAISPHRCAIHFRVFLCPLTVHLSLVDRETGVTHDPPKTAVVWSSSTGSRSPGFWTETSVPTCSEHISLHSHATCSWNANCQCVLHLEMGHANIYMLLCTLHFITN